MNIEEFEQQEIRSIHNFCTDWLDNHQADPEKYPLDLDINALYTKSENNVMIKTTEHVIELSELPTLETLLEMATVVMNWNADEGRFRSVIHFTWNKNTKDTELYYLSLYELQENLETIGYDVSGNVILYGYKMSISWGDL